WIGFWWIVSASAVWTPAPDRDCDALAPMSSWPVVVRRPGKQPPKENTRVEDQPVPLVRPPGGRGRQPLRLHLQEFEDRPRGALWRRRSGTQGIRHDRRVPARGTGFR